MTDRIHVHAPRRVLTPTPAAHKRGALRPRDKTDPLRLLYDLGCAFAGQMEIETLIPFVIRQCRDVLDAGGASVLFFDRSTGAPATDGRRYE